MPYEIPGLASLLARGWFDREVPGLNRAVIAVASVVIGWGVAQYPDVLVDHLTIEQAAGAHATLVGLLIVFGVAAVIAVPAVVWLYVLVNRLDWAAEPVDH